MKDIPAPCEEAISRLLRHCLSDWAGLPQDCPEATLLNALPLSQGIGLARLGVDVIEYRFRAIAAPDFTEPVRLYFLSGMLRLVRTGLWSADPNVSASLLNDFGTPEARLDLTLDVTIQPGSALLYPSRGLMLGVVPATGLIATVEAFQPCTMNHYRRQLYNAEPPREFPLRR